MRARVLVIFYIMIVAGSLFGPGPAQAEAQRQAVVHLRSDSTVAGPNILLGEIAEIEALDDGLRRELHRLVVGRAPLPGQRRELHVATIRTRMRQQRLPVNDIQVVTETPEITVHTRALVVEGAALAAAAHDALRQGMAKAPVVGEGNGRLDLSCTPPGPVTVPGGEAALQVQANSIGGPGALVAMVDVLVDGDIQRTVPVRCDATLERDVLVATAPLGRHAVLSGDGYEVVRRAFTALPREGLLPAVEPGLWRMARPVPAGTVLTYGMVEPVPVVRRGDRVHIVAATGGIVVTAPGIALQDGGVQQMIQVENAVSGHVVEAYVVDEETVSPALY